MKIDRNRILLGLVIVAVVAGVALILRPDPVPVETRSVERGPLRVTVEEDGETRVRDRYLVSAPVTGRMVRLECEAGDPVARGQVLARIHPLPLDTRARSEVAERLEAAEAAARAAGAAVERAAALRDDARRARERLERVAADVRGAVAEQRLDAARTAERTAALAFTETEAAAEAARHEVEAARAALLGSDALASEPTLVRAPADGRVLRVYEECERAVSAGAPIVEIGDPDDLEVWVDVLTEDAIRLQPGTAARITVGPESDTLEGTVRRIDPSAFTRVSPLGVEEQRVNVVVTFDEAPATLGDRFRVDAELVVWQSDDVLEVPVGALFRTDGGWGVFVVTDGRAHLRPVVLGHRGRREAEVVSGLAVGDRVVVYPSEAVTDGARVAVTGSEFDEGTVPRR